MLAKMLYHISLKGIKVFARALEHIANQFPEK